MLRHVQSWAVLGDAKHESKMGTPSEGEDVVRPLLQFEVYRHLSRMTKRELELIRTHYYMPDYLELHLPRPFD